jgi:hypothetical protein
MNSVHNFPTCVTSILILSFHSRLYLPHGLFLSDFPTKFLCAFLVAPMRATCFAHLIFLDLLYGLQLLIQASITDNFNIRITFGRGADIQTQNESNGVTLQLTISQFVLAWNRTETYDRVWLQLRQLRVCQLCHLQFSLEAASPETFGYTLINVAEAMK